MAIKKLIPRVRCELKIIAEDKALLKETAAKQNMTMSDFVVQLVKEFNTRKEGVK